MAIKGFQNTRTKAQNLTEIMFSQDGFLGGLNKDMPKSDVGPTQLTVAKNVIPYRDRVEARGGIKPLVGYTTKNGSETGLLSSGTFPPIYDNELDEFFRNTDGNLVNYGKKNRGTAHCYNYDLWAGTAPDLSGEDVRVKDGLFFTTYTYNSGPFRNHFVEYREGSDDYFVRPLTSNTTSLIKTNVGSKGTPAPLDYMYSFLTSFVRIVNGSVVAESNIIGKMTFKINQELDGSTEIFTISGANGGYNFYPQDYFDSSFTGENNFYTHARYYRGTVNEDGNEGDLFAAPAYYVGDYPINDFPGLDPLPVNGLPLDLNITDNQMTSDSSRAVVWQSGYQPIPGTSIACSSSGMFLCRNENRKNEFIYCPIGSGDNRKYLGWYNPLYQYGSVDGDITQMHDMGSYVLITTKNRTYYVDTVNYIENEGQREAAIFTPILPESVLISDTIGINENQKNAFVKSSTGSAIGITSDGEIREFSGYQWGPDLSLGKVSSITKGEIAREISYCQAAFVNDAYYLGYRTGSAETKTLRLGTTEESGYGFSEFCDGGWAPISASGSINTKIVFFFNINGILCVFNSVFGGVRQVMEYTGDVFDKKINKDIIDVYVGNDFLYNATTYYDIPVEIEFPEATASSESYFLYFLKSHFFLRGDRYAYKVDDESTPGYEIVDDDLTPVSLSDTTFEMDVRKGEGDDVVASNEDFSPTSAVVVRRDVMDHRIRTTLKADSAGFQLTGLEIYFKRHNRTEIEDTGTTTTIEELNTDLYCHITEKNANLAIGDTTGTAYDIGAPLEGAKIGQSSEGRPVTDISFQFSTQGPDGSDNGFFVNGTFEYLSGQRNFTGYTVMFWSNGVTGGVETGWTTSASNLFTGEAGGQYKHYCYIANGSNLDLYIDGVFDSSAAIDAVAYSFINSIRISDGTYSDIRMYNKVITEEQLLFYIDNVLNNQGDYLNGY